MKGRIMKTIKSILAACIVALTVCSCSNKYYYQVYDVNSNGLEKTENALIYSNDEVAVSYNLWSEAGTLTFMFENKTDKNIFIDMPKSFYIQNGVAYDYYSETTNSYSVTNLSQASRSASATVFGSIYRNGMWYPGTVTRTGQVSSAVSMTKSSSTKDPKFIVVPPHSAKRIASYSISNYINYNCDNMKENIPKKESQIVRFSRENSPLVFRNRIAYSSEENDSNPSYIDNEFYVESYHNYNYKSAVKSFAVKDCLSDFKTFSNKFIIAGPDRFYNKYKINR